MIKWKENWKPNYNCFCRCKGSNALLNTHNVFSLWRIKVVSSNQVTYHGCAFLFEAELCFPCGWGLEPFSSFRRLQPTVRSPLDAAKATVYQSSISLTNPLLTDALCWKWNVAWLLYYSQTRSTIQIWGLQLVTINCLTCSGFGLTFYFPYADLEAPHVLGHTQIL